MTPKHKDAIRIFERDNWICCYCGTQYSEDYSPLHRHRRVFGSQGGTYKDDDNKATCCYICHHAHGSLKNRPLLSENGDMTKINELIKRYNNE